MAKQTDMSALEYRAAVAQFLPTVGRKAECYTSIENYGLMFSAAFNGVDAVDGEYGQPASFPHF